MEKEFPGFISNLFGLGTFAHLPVNTVVVDIGEAINKIYFVLHGLFVCSNTVVRFLKVKFLSPKSNFYMHIPKILC